MFRKVLLPVNIKQFDEGITLESVKKFISDNQQNAEVQAYLQGLYTVEGVQTFVRENADGRKWFDSEKDKHHSKALETWKANNLEKLIDEEIKKRNPGKTPEQIEIEKLRKQIEDAERARNREALVNKALKVAKEKNLPDGIIDFFIADDEEGTMTNLTKLEEEYSRAVQAAVEAKFKENGRNIYQSTEGGSAGTIDIGSLAEEVSIRD